jgi:hypothetical protein
MSTIRPLSFVAVLALVLASCSAPFEEARREAEDARRQAMQAEQEARDQREQALKARKQHDAARQSAEEEARNAQKKAEKAEKQIEELKAQIDQARAEAVNFKRLLDKEQKLRLLEQANLKANQAQVSELKADLQAKLEQTTATLKRMQDDLKDQLAVNKTLAEKLLADEKKTQRADALNKAAQVEVERRQVDVEKLREVLRLEMEKSVKLVKEHAALREQMTAALIQAAALKDNNSRLETELRDLAKTVAQLQANPKAPVGRIERNPPAENIEGVVKGIEKGGQVKISVGTEAGLAKGHTMEVFRLDTTNPAKSKYLGVIRIVDISATEAIGQPVGKLAAPIEVGDHVASRIPGS